MKNKVIYRDALMSCSIGIVAGLFWILWAAMGLSAHSVGAATVIALSGLVVGLVMLSVAVRRLRLAGRRDVGSGTRASAFASRRYRFVVFAEIVVCAAGSVSLNVLGCTEYVAPFVAVVVGIHFLGLRFMSRFSGVLSVALIVAGVLGVLVGVFGGDGGWVTAVTGVVAAASLFGGSIHGLVSTR